MTPLSRYFPTLPQIPPVTELPTIEVSRIKAACPFPVFCPRRQVSSMAEEPFICGKIRFPSQWVTVVMKPAMSPPQDSECDHEQPRSRRSTFRSGSHACQRSARRWPEALFPPVPPPNAHRFQSLSGQILLLACCSCESRFHDRPSS